MKIRNESITFYPKGKNPITEPLEKYETENIEDLKCAVEVLKTSGKFEILELNTKTGIGKGKYKDDDKVFTFKKIVLSAYHKQISEYDFLKK